MIPMEGRTRGQDIYSAFKTFVAEENLPLQKLVSITTDGAPAMKAGNNGFIGLCKKDPDFPKFQSYHCIIHQQVLCGKSARMREVIGLVVKIVNSIRAKALQRRQFRSLLDDMASEYGDLPLHTEVRWLSKGRVLRRFLELISEIKLFINERGDVYEELDDINWLMDLAFLTDVTGLLNDLNQNLQGKNKSVSLMISFVNTFKNKLHILISQLKKKEIKHFKYLKNQIDKQGDGEDLLSRKLESYVDLLEKLLTEFEERFQDFQELEPIVIFFSFPFSEIDVVEKAHKIGDMFSLDVTELENEIIVLQSDVDLKARCNDAAFWKLVSDEKYSNLKKIALILKAYFASTYLCESTFSNMKHIKSKNRSVLTNEHLNDCIRLSGTSYIPNYRSLAEQMQCKSSKTN